MATNAPSASTDADEILSRIRDAIDRGHDLTFVERAVLRPLAHDPDRRDGLWLYAWAYHARRGRA